MQNQNFGWRLAGFIIGFLAVTTVAASAYYQWGLEPMNTVDEPKAVNLTTPAPSPRTPQRNEVTYGKEVFHELINIVEQKGKMGNDGDKTFAIKTKSRMIVLRLFLTGTEHKKKDLSVHSWFKFKKRLGSKTVTAREYNLWILLPDRFFILPHYEGILGDDEIAKEKQAFNELCAKLNITNK